MKINIYYLVREFIILAARILFIKKKYKIKYLHVTVIFEFKMH